MAKEKSKPKSPFLGRWHIVSMTKWDEDYINEEIPAFIEFGGTNRVLLFGCRSRTESEPLSRGELSHPGHRLVSRSKCPPHELP